MHFEKILDGYVLAALLHMEMSLTAVYNAYMQILARHSIPEPTDFMIMIKSAEYARQCEDKQNIMQQVNYMYDFVTGKI